MKRFFDFSASLIGLILLSPIFIILIVLININSKGGAFFLQPRVGLYGKSFNLFKFRSMYKDSAKKGLLTIGSKDHRVTPVGRFIRKYKLDELPQLFNVLIGDMSLVGPRPEVKKYVDLYTEEQRIILNVKPGITDYASIKFRNENELLKLSDNPEQFYIHEIMPQKIALNMIFINNPKIYTYFKIIFKTVIFTVIGK
jgi:lipopolysaccharide/colanic/teichoic acid biosynthesis glycosyltransferase